MEKKFGDLITTLGRHSAEWRQVVTIKTICRHSAKEEASIMQDAMNKLVNYVDPEFPNGIPALPILPTQPTAAPAEDADTEWVTWTGTYYPTLESVPWQARGSATEVPARR